METLARIHSKKHNKSIVELGLVKSVEVAGGRVRVLLKPAENCLCPYPFILAARAEVELRKLPGIEEVVVEVEI